MNFSFIIKSLVLSFFVFIMIFAISFVSNQKNILDNNNYGVRDSIKESINIAEYRKSGDIAFDIDTLIESTIRNYITNNNIKIDEVTIEIALDEVENIVTVNLYTSKNFFDSFSDIEYSFSYQVIERPTIMCQDKIEKKFKHKLGTQKAEKWSLKIFLSKIKFFALQAALLSFT